MLIYRDANWLFINNGVVFKVSVWDEIEKIIKGCSFASPLSWTWDRPAGASITHVLDVAKSYIRRYIRIRGPPPRRLPFLPDLAALLNKRGQVVLNVMNEVCTICFVWTDPMNADKPHDACM